MEEEMKGIVAFADTLGDIDAQGVPPTAHAVPLTNVMREDEVMKPLEREALLAGAPEAYDGFFLVPWVLE